VVRNLIAEIHLHPGETILDVGCGSGVLDRWLARHTGGAHRITAVDIHRTLLREAAALATKEGLAEHIEFREGNAEVLPFGDNSFDVTMSATVMELLDAERMLREMVRVTRPGGRVGVVVRAIDMQSFVNVPVRAELKMKIAALPNGLAGARGCADGSLYQRFRNAGLQDVQMLPQLATYAGARAHAADERIEATLSPAELAEWHTAVTQAEERFSSRCHSTAQSAPSRWPVGLDRGNDVAGHQIERATVDDSVRALHEVFLEQPQPVP
jgi:ubiquinone/menaquinone biosynthesis C-methylase UbiE